MPVRAAMEPVLLAATDIATRDSVQTKGLPGQAYAKTQSSPQLWAGQAKRPDAGLSEEPMVRS